jgi:hypothetical protein
MGVRSAFLFAILLLIAALAALNWGTLSAPVPVSLGFMTVSAPLGLMMLGLTVALAVFFLVYVLYLHSSVLLDTKRHNKEMQVQRDLADKAEASRFTELRNFLEAQENKHMAQNAERHAALLTRVGQLESVIRQRSEQSDNTVAAHIGQLEDRIERRPLPADIDPRALKRIRGALLRGQHPGRELLRVGFADLIVRRHRHRPPHARAALDDLDGELVGCALVVLVLRGHILEAGPSTLRSTAWQLMQFFDVARARSAKAGAARPMPKPRTADDKSLFMGM